MKQSSSQLRTFVESLLDLSQDALRFSQRYVERSKKEPHNPELALFFRNALGVVQELQVELAKTAPRSKTSRRKK